MAKVNTRVGIVMRPRRTSVKKTATVFKTMALIGVLSACDNHTADTTPTAAVGEVRQPNIVYVLTDQWRDQYTPPERRQGFEYWKALEVSHQYNELVYYEGDNPEKKQWPGYGPYAETDEAISYIEQHARSH